MTKLNKRVLFLIDEGFEESELRIPCERLKAEGHKTAIVAPDKKQRRAWHDFKWGENVPVDLEIDDVKVDEFDGIIIPGGLIAPHRLRVLKSTVTLIRKFYWDGRVVGAIGHACALLIEADIIKGHKVTSFKSLRTDMINAGSSWIDQPVVADRHIVTAQDSRSIVRFTEFFLKELQTGRAVPEFA